MFYRYSKEIMGAKRNGAKMKEIKRKKLIDSFRYAICGFKSAYKNEQNIKIHILIMIVVIIAGIILKINKIKWVICIMLFGMVISAELINTAIESLVDIAMPEINPKAKYIKDVAASYVMVIAISAAVIGIILFLA